MIEQTARVLFPERTVTELRVIDTPRHGTVSGYFDDHTALVRAARQWSGKAPAVYATLNPCQPALLARAANRLKERARATTSDGDILRRVWFPLDFDPVRPAGVSSTEEEHAAALARAEACTTWLTSRGWPQPVVADSGNGGHLLYPIDLPNTEESRQLVQHGLDAIALFFTDHVVSLDVSVFNAARIWKLYGTMACKGDHLPERPHRLSTLLSVPQTRTCVTEEQLVDLAALLPTPTQTPPPRGPAGAAFNLAHWIATHRVPVASEGPWQQSGHKWVLNPCPWNPDHTNKAAFIVQHSSGAIAAGCHHNGCQGNDWHALRDLYEPGWQQRREGPAEDAQHRTNGQHPEPKPRVHAVRITGSALLATQYAPLVHVVEPILPAGCTLFTGKSKDGKSMLVYNICVAVMTGNKALGTYPVTQGHVWYLALEDGERRAQRRLRMQEAHMGAIPRALQDHIEFTLWEAPRLGAGLEDDIRDWILTTPDARLVVIDILEKVRPLRRRNGNMYAEDYAATQSLTRLAQEHNVSVFVVHHANKLNPTDFRDSASGAMSLIGGADNYWSLSRMPFSEEATLKVTGRDIEQELDLSMQFKDGFWTVIDDGGIGQMSKERRDIYDVLVASFKPMTPKQVAERLGKDYEQTKYLMFKMKHAGSLVQPVEGHYAPAPPFTTNPANSTNPTNPANSANSLVHVHDRVSGVSGELAADKTPQHNGFTEVREKNTGSVSGVSGVSDSAEGGSESQESQESQEGQESHIVTDDGVVDPATGEILAEPASPEGHAGLPDPRAYAFMYCEACNAVCAVRHTTEPDGRAGKVWCQACGRELCGWRGSPNPDAGAQPEIVVRSVMYCGHNQDMDAAFGAAPPPLGEVNPETDGRTDGVVDQTTGEILEEPPPAPPAKIEYERWEI
jgi:hypothetical protein